MIYKKQTKTSASEAFLAALNADYGSETNPFLTEDDGGSGFVPYTGATGNVDLNNKTLTNVKTLGLNAATTTSAPLQFTASATIPLSPTNASLWYSTTTGLTVYDSTAGINVFSWTDGTIKGSLSVLTGAGVFIGSSSNDNLTFMTNDGAGAGYGAVLWTNGGFKINPAPAVTPTAMLTVQPGSLTNLVELKTSAETVNLWVISNQGNADITPSVSTSGAVRAFSITNPANTNQTLSTEISGLRYVGGSRQWAAGAITTQRETYLSTTTYTAVGASVITSAYGLYIEAPTASTNIIITNNWALGLNGGLKVENGFKVQIGNEAVTGLVAGALAALTTASIVLYDSTGQAYRIPCII